MELHHLPSKRRVDAVIVGGRLRAEVAQLRTALEGLPTTAPDCSPTLAAIAQSLAAMEAHPALRLTPDALASQVRQASEAAQQQGRR